MITRKRGFSAVWRYVFVEDVEFVLRVDQPSSGFWKLQVIIAHCFAFSGAAGVVRRAEPSSIYRQDGLTSASNPSTGSLLLTGSEPFFPTGSDHERLLTEASLRSQRGSF